MGMSSGGGGGTVSDINVTPLVDVMLVLLIIFMVTAPMLNNAGVEIDLPKAETEPLDMSEEDQLILSVEGDGTVWIRDIETTMEDLPFQLKNIADASPDQPVFLRADGDLAYREVVRVLEIAKGSGMPRVGLVFDPMKEEGE